MSVHRWEGRLCCHIAPLLFNYYLCILYQYLLLRTINSIKWTSFWLLKKWQLRRWRWWNRIHLCHDFRPPLATLDILAPVLQEAMVPIFTVAITRLVGWLQGADSHRMQLFYIASYIFSENQAPLGATNSSKKSKPIANKCYFPYQFM